MPFRILRLQRYTLFLKQQWIFEKNCNYRAIVPNDVVPNEVPKPLTLNRQLDELAKASGLEVAETPGRRHRRCVWRGDSDTSLLWASERAN